MAKRIRANDDDQPLLANGGEVSETRGEGYRNLMGTPAERILPYQNRVGRPKGSQNRVTVVLKDAILQAAEETGEDGAGKDGLVGYLKRLALKEPSTFGGLLKHLLPVRVKANIDADSVLVQMLEAVRARQAQLSLIDGKPWKNDWQR